MQLEGAASAQLAGRALAGGFANKIAPELVITVLLVVLLYLTSERTVKKGLKLYAKESAAFSAMADARVALDDAERQEETKGLLDDDGGEPKGVDDEKRAALDRILAEERRAFPPDKVAVLAGGQRQVEEAGAWHVAARHHGLRFRFASGLRHIQGKVDGIEVSVRQNGQVADVQVSVPQQVFVRPGKGDSGNPVLDLLVDSQGIPDAVVEPVLEVVHGRGGVIDRGVLRVSWTGDIKGCLDSVLAIARGLRGPATPTG